jgi:peptide/nickel transport system ATP-binding protein
MIFQEPMMALNPVMRIGDQISETLHAHQKINKAKAREKVILWLQKVQLPDPLNMMNKYPHQLSGGQKQRVMIAMAMCCEPALLIADEPTTALDTTTQKEILYLLKDLQAKTGMALLFITHDLGIVKEMADDVAVMQKGKIVEYNNKINLFDQPLHPYTQSLMQCRATHYVKGKQIRVDGFNEFDQEQIITHSKGLKNIIAADKPLLEIRDLTVMYPGKKSFWGKRSPDFEALKKISLSIHKGETVGLVGESGCGKTTLSSTLLGLTPFTNGEIILHGKRYNQETYPQFKERYKEIQVVFQDPNASLNPRIQIGEVIEEPLMVHKRFNKRSAAKAYVVDLLEKVKLQADFYGRYPHQLSGGQRQRLVIARALAMQPDLIIWDESVSALDVRIQAQVLNLLNDLKSQYHFSSLFISHDLSVIKYISDRMYVMQKGSIVESGSPEEIWNDPKHPHTKRLLEAVV